MTKRWNLLQVYDVHSEVNGLLTQASLCVSLGFVFWRCQGLVRNLSRN